MEIDTHILWRHLWTYSTSLWWAPWPYVEEQVEPHYFGSATFVRHHGEHCVLTADHVWEAVRENEKVKLIGFVTDPGKRVVWAPIESLQEIDRHRGGDDYFGPDVALERLHPREVESLGKTKAFFDLDRSDVKDAGETDVTWTVIGSPGRTVRVDPISKDSLFDAHMTQHTIGAREPAFFQHDGLKHADIPFGNTPSDAIPDSWRGLSGAGLWRVGLKPNESGELAVAGRPAFAGVAFCEIYDGPKRGVIRTHALTSFGIGRAGRRRE